MRSNPAVARPWLIWCSMLPVTLTGVSANIPSVTNAMWLTLRVGDETDPITLDPRKHCSAGDRNQRKNHHRRRKFP